MRWFVIGAKATARMGAVCRARIAEAKGQQAGVSRARFFRPVIGRAGAALRGLRRVLGAFPGRAIPCVVQKTADGEAASRVVRGPKLRITTLFRGVQIEGF